MKTIVNYSSSIVLSTRNHRIHPLIWDYHQSCVGLNVCNMEGSPVLGGLEMIMFAHWNSLCRAFIYPYPAFSKERPSFFVWQMTLLYNFCHRCLRENAVFFLVQMIHALWFPRGSIRPWRGVIQQLGRCWPCLGSQSFSTAEYTSGDHWLNFNTIYIYLCIAIHITYVYTCAFSI